MRASSTRIATRCAGVSARRHADFSPVDPQARSWDGFDRLTARGEEALEGVNARIVDATLDAGDRRLSDTRHRRKFPLREARTRRRALRSARPSFMTLNDSPFAITPGLIGLQRGNDGHAASSCEEHSRPAVSIGFRHVTKPNRGCWGSQTAGFTANRAVPDAPAPKRHVQASRRSRLALSMVLTATFRASRAAAGLRFAPVSSLGPFGAVP